MLQIYSIGQQVLQVTTFCCRHGLLPWAVHLWHALHGRYGCPAQARLSVRTLCSSSASPSCTLKDSLQLSRKVFWFPVPLLSTTTLPSCNTSMLQVSKCTQSCHRDMPSYLASNEIVIWAKLIAPCMFPLCKPQLLNA